MFLSTKVLLPPCRSRHVLPHWHCGKASMSADAKSLSHVTWRGELFITSKGKIPHLLIRDPEEIMLSSSSKSRMLTLCLFLEGGRLTFSFLYQ